MIHPTIHLNGTSAEALRDGYEDALVAVRDAIRAIAMNAPNHRDYYPQGVVAWQAALDEHRQRMFRLAEVADELTAIVNRVQDTIDAREALKETP
jgi:hypothetical protein